VGLGVPGVSSALALEAPGPKGLAEPYDCLLFPLKPAPPIAFCNNGLAPGEKGDPEILPDAELPFLESGEFEYPSLLPGDPLNGVGVLANLGGVAYFESGVGGTELGGRPSNFRWAVVRAISERSSFFLKAGHRATMMLNANTNCTAQ
jgi:hypothetical protein